MRRGQTKQYVNPPTGANPKPATKSNVVILPRAANGKLRLRAMGSVADESMKPGEYRVRCLSSEINQRGGKLVIVLKHKICEGAYNDGVLLTQWLNIKGDTGNVSPLTKYANQCSIALRREIEADDELDPKTIFVGKEFLAEVGFSMKGGDSKLADENAGTKKSDKDFLRVHRLLSLL